MKNSAQITMEDWINVVDRQKTFVPASIVEIGSMDGEDSAILENHYSTGKVTVIEAHPTFYERISTKYPNFAVYNFAVSDSNGTVEFNAVTEDSSNLGISSIHDRSQSWPAYGGTQFSKVQIPTVRMDTFLIDHGIAEIDLLKVDVEGHSFEVLVGFGDLLKNVKSIHIENEHVEVWSGQKLYRDVEKILVDSGFILTSIRVGWPQTDSIWIRSDLFNGNWRNS